MKTEHRIQITHKITKDQWSDFCLELTETKKNCFLSLEIANLELGNEKIVQKGSLSSITFNPEGKGNDLEISMGGDEVFLSHFVSDPKVIWAGEDEQHHIVALEIIDEEESQTILHFVD